MGLAVGFGDVEQQAFEQLIRRWLIDPGDALLQQALEFLVGILEQTAQRRAVGEIAAGHGLDQRRSDTPQGLQWRVLAQRFEPREHLGHVTQLRLHILFTQQTDQCGLQRLAQLAQFCRQFRAVTLCEGLIVECGD